jgi:hypothetical protein
MIPKSGHRFSEKIVLKGKAERSASHCGACRYFIGAPATLERAIPGFNILSSAYGSVRGDTGLCERHDIFVTARNAACPEFEETADPGIIAGMSR